MRTSISLNFRLVRLIVPGIVYDNAGARVLDVRIYALPVELWVKVHKICR
jgi:hypothetical protein